MNMPSSTPHDFLSQAHARPIRGVRVPTEQHHEAPPVSEYAEYLRAIRLRKWSILAFALLVGALAGFVVSQVPPRFLSVATVLIETNKAKLVQVEDVYSGISQNREYLQTQAEVLKSREVARRVVRKLDLVHHPLFDPRQAAERRSPIQLWVEGIWPELGQMLWPPVGPISDEAAEAAVLKAVSGRLSVEPVRLSQLVRVGFESTDPALAAAIANAIAEAYVQSDLDARSKITHQAGSWIHDRLGELKTKLDASERALQSYREREGILDGKSTVLGGNARQMDELTQRLVDARVRRSEAEESYNQVKAGEPSNYETVPAIVRNGPVQRAKEIQADAERKLNEVSQRYGPDHPRHVAAESELATARENTRRQTETVVASILKEYRAALATERTLEDAVSKSRAQIQSLNRKEIQLGVLEREATANRQVYQTFLARMKETSATGDAQQPIARIVDPAIASSVPVWPQKRPVVVIAALGALLLAAACAVVLSALNDTIHTSHDVETRLRQPFLAALPRLTGKRRGRAASEMLDNPQGLYAEAIRTATTGVLLSALDVQRKVVLVTSSVAGEGKSTFSMNFAFSQSRSKRVLLIEADLRRPSLGDALKVPRTQIGVTECIAGSATLEQALLQVNATTLHVLVAGRIPPNPLELLASDRFGELLAQVHASYDMVVIDTPPVQLVSDALVLGQLVTGVVYVVKADDTPAPVVRAGLARFVAAQIPVFGVLLNGQDFKRAERYYGENTVYGRYGYESGYSSKPS